MSIVPRTQLPLVVCALIPAEISISQVLVNFGCAVVTVHNGVIVGQLGNITVLPIPHDAIEESVVLSSDAVILVLDGNLGLSPNVIDAWRSVCDWDIPRQIAVVNAVTGRADFDEVVAICERVLEDSLVVRYLPVENDDSTGVDGLYDILTSELHVRNASGSEIRSADPEHVALTAEKREVLIEDIAHAAMSDEQLASLNDGMPISIPAVEQAWVNSGLVTVVPIENGIAAHLVSAWLLNRESRWIPMVHAGEEAFAVDELPHVLGLGVGKGIARLWNRDRAVWLERKHGRQSPVIDDDMVVRGALAFSRDIKNGDTIRPQASLFELSEPRF